MNEYHIKTPLPFLTDQVFKFVRNIISHFPLFDSWDEVWISKSLINWNKTDQSIDKFLRKNKGKETLGFAYKEENEDEYKFPTMVYFKFPKTYDDDSKIFLKDLISEKDVIIFSVGLMIFMIKTVEVIVKALESNLSKN